MSENPDNPPTALGEEALQLAIVKAAEEYNEQQDCTCGETEDWGTCWYHLTAAEQMNWRVGAVADRLEIDEAVVRAILA